VHKNARLTPKGRALMLGRLEAGQHQRDVAQAMGVSLTTLKKWLRRYRAEGPAGLLDRSCRPAVARDNCRGLLPNRSSG
jgi:transposase